MNQIEYYYNLGINDALEKYGFRKKAWLPVQFAKSIIPTFRAVSGMGKSLAEQLGKVPINPAVKATKLTKLKLWPALRTSYLENVPKTHNMSQNILNGYVGMF